MIISHRHRFIFIKTAKTAGTSVEIALSSVCGANDIITPVSAKDEAIRCEMGGRRPQHYRAPLWEYRGIDVRKLLRKRRLKRRFYNHISAEKVRGLIGERTWNNYYKFCFERNPWDRAVSFYHWRCQNEPRPTFSEFIASDMLLKLKRQGFGLYSINGDVVVDDVFRFEQLKEGLAQVTERLGLAGRLELPRTKSNVRKDKGRRYQDYYTDEDRQRVADVFVEEIALMGYRFECDTED